MIWVSEGRSRQRAAFMLCKAVGDGSQRVLLSEDVAKSFRDDDQDNDCSEPNQKSEKMNLRTSSMGLRKDGTGRRHGGEWLLTTPLSLFRPMPKWLLIGKF